MNKDLEKFDERSAPEEKSLLPQEPSFLSAIERLAANPNVDVEKIKQIVEMQGHILDRNAKQFFNASMVKAQSQMEVVLKTTDGEHGKFANLEAVLEMARPIYTGEGFAVTFYEGFSTEEKPLKPGYIRMMADIMHTEGHTKTVTADVPFDDKGPQGTVIKTGPHATGSSFAYGRRYLNCMIWNIATGDDDNGKAAGGGGKIKLLEQWEIKCNEAGEAASSVEDMVKWWADNGTPVKKELSKAAAATIYALVVAHKNRLKALLRATDPDEREPGSDDQ